MNVDNETKEILQRLTRLETKMDVIISARDTAFEALASTKSAHKRLDELERTTEPTPELLATLTETTKTAHARLDRHDKYIFWFSTTIIGALILGAIMLLFKTQ